MIKKVALLQIITAFVILLSFKLALATIPPTLNYQGHLTDSSGAPVDGPVNMVFAIYDVETGGTALWSDSLSVTVNQGVFSVELGAVSPLPPGLFELSLWVGLTVETDAEMAPRRPVSSVGFSFKAGDADRLEGISAATLDQSAHVGDSANPHSVTAAQVGAVTSADISTHAGDASAHHSKTDSFSELTGTIADAQIPALIARDAEIMPTVLASDGPGTGLNADLLDGLTSNAFMPAFTDLWVNTTGDNMTGNLTTTGRIGIGVPPSYSLDVRGGTPTYLGFFQNDNKGIGNALGTYTLADARDTGTGSAYGTKTFAYGGSTSGAAYGNQIYANAYGSSPSYAVYADADGGTTTGNEYAFFGYGKGYFSDNLGLGITSPGYKLHVSGGAATYMGFFSNDNNGSGSAYGTYTLADARDTGTSSAFGARNLAYGGSTSGPAYASLHYARAYGASNAYGVYSHATEGTTTGKEYALYGIGDGYISQDFDVNGTSFIGFQKVTGASQALSSSISSCSALRTAPCYYAYTSVACPTNTVALGGGCFNNSYTSSVLSSSYPVTGGWACRAVGASSSYYVRAYANCARVGN